MREQSKEEAEEEKKSGSVVSIVCIEFGFISIMAKMKREKKKRNTSKYKFQTE